MHRYIWTAAAWARNTAGSVRNLTMRVFQNVSFLAAFFFSLYILLLRANYALTWRVCFCGTLVSFGALTRSLSLSSWTHFLVPVSVLLISPISPLFFRITFGWKAFSFPRALCTYLPTLLAYSQWMAALKAQKTNPLMWSEVTFGVIYAPELSKRSGWR